MQYLAIGFILPYILGALYAMVATDHWGSLSEPHTSVTALRTHVCIYACLFGPTTYRKF